MEWMRYIGKEMLPRKTTKGYEKILRRKGEKCIEKMTHAAPRKENVHWKPPMVRKRRKVFTCFGEDCFFEAVEHSRPASLLVTIWRIGAEE